MAAVLEDWEHAPVSDRLRGALRLLEAMTKRPESIDVAFIQGLREAGLDDLDIEEAASVGFHFNLINRIADAYDFPIPSAEQKGKIASILSFMGRMFWTAWPTERFKVGADGRTRPIEVHHGRERVLSAPGSTDPSLRRAVEAHCAALRGGRRGPDLAVPTYLESYLKRLATYAFGIDDACVSELRDAGLNDDQLFELTFAGAYGASCVGLEEVCEALVAEVQTSAAA